jgi:hypothetical protein
MLRRRGIATCLLFITASALRTACLACNTRPTSLLTYVQAQCDAFNGIGCNAAMVDR